MVVTNTETNPRGYVGTGEVARRFGQPVWRIRRPWQALRLPGPAQVARSPPFPHLRLNPANDNAGSSIATCRGDPEHTAAAAFPPDTVAALAG